LRQKVYWLNFSSFKSYFIGLPYWESNVILFDRAISHLFFSQQVTKKTLLASKYWCRAFMRITRAAKFLEHKRHFFLQKNTIVWLLGVNFNNILRPAFLDESVLSSFCVIFSLCFGGGKLGQRLLVKCWWNWLLGRVRYWVLRASYIDC